MWKTIAFEMKFKKSLYMAFKKIVWTVFSIPALQRPGMALLNFGMHQFSLSEWLIHSKKRLKRNLLIEIKGNPLSHFSFRESFPNTEIAIPNLVFHQCFCSKRLFYPTRHLKGIITCCLKKIIEVHFLWYALLKSKVGLRNLDLTNFSAVNDIYILNNM